MPSKSTFIRGFKTRAENLAILYREQLSISKFKPLDAFKLADHLDIPIFSVDDVFSGDKSNPAYSLMTKAENFNALWMANEDGDKIILHNCSHSKFRQQSNLMHELAHIILEHEVPEEARKICSIYNLHYYNKQQEDEAKYLGGCLQITKPALLWVLKEGWEHEKISDYYCASLEMVRYRLFSSGAVKQNNYH